MVRRCAFTLDTVPPVTSSENVLGYPLDSHVSPANPPCLRLRPIPPGITRRTLTANGFPCWVKRVPDSTSRLPNESAPITPWFANSRIFMSRRSPSTSYSVFTHSSSAFHFLRRSTAPVSRVRCGECMVTYRGIFSSLSECWAWDWY